MAINRTTYDIVLNAVYRDVYWERIDVVMVKSLICLSKPSIAARVRRLHIRPWFVRFMYDKEMLQKHDQYSIPSRLAGISPWVRRYLGRGGSAFSLEVEAFRAQLNSGKAKHVVKAMQAAAANMSGLNECVVETRCLPPIAAPFFLTLSTVIVSNLRKLDVQCSALELATLTTAGLRGLEEFRIALEFQACHESADALARDQQYLVTGLAALLNGLASSLSTLRLACYARLDLSPFFNALGVFPSLHQLSLHISLAPDLLSNPAALVHFLCQQSQQLRSVELLPQFYELGPHIWGDFFSRVAMVERALSELDELKVFYPVDLDVVDDWISRSKETLKRLYLYRRFLSLPQVKHLGLVFPRLHINLTALHLEVHVLCPAIFDILSRHTLSLQSLNLVYQAVGGTYLSSNGDEHQHSPHAADLDSTEFRMVSLPTHFLLTPTMADANTKALDPRLPVRMCDDGGALWGLGPS
ncbi:hypothetical protein EYR36_005291 [Pleurotus pulmonarius]|nr:hypothetical protein EYR36_005291 [Pleurotus pulmonarius]